MKCVCACVRNMRASVHQCYFCLKITAEREEGAAGGAHCPTHVREEAVRDDEPRSDRTCSQKDST